MELIDIYNADRVKTGRTMERGAPMAKGDYMLVVHVCIFNPRGEMLIQQRQTHKMSWAGLWDISMGGCSSHGESSHTAAEREVFEELGVKIELSDQLPHFSVNFERGFDDFYLVERDLDIDSLVLQAEEVQQVRWASRSEIMSMIDNGTFIPYYKSIIDLAFDMRGGYGAHSGKKA